MRRYENKILEASMEELKNIELIRGSYFFGLGVRRAGHVWYQNLRAGQFQNKDGGSQEHVMRENYSCVDPRSDCSHLMQCGRTTCTKFGRSGDGVQR